MALKDTVNAMRGLLVHLCKDLEKAVNGNKAAAQRVRTGSIRLEKTAKTFRKESVAAEKRAPKRKKAPAKKAPAKKKKR